MDEIKINESIEVILACKRVFSSEDGKLVLEHLKGIAHYDTNTVLSTDVNDLTKWREGKRSLLLDIIYYINLDVEVFRKRAKEQLRQMEDYQ